MRFWLEVVLEANKKLNQHKPLQKQKIYSQNWSSPGPFISLPLNHPFQVQNHTTKIQTSLPTSCQGLHSHTVMQWSNFITVDYFLSSKWFFSLIFFSYRKKVFDIEKHKFFSLNFLHKNLFSFIIVVWVS